jgi:hypothetical protein
MKVFRKLEQIFSAVAFAQSGEHETAQYVREREEGKAATSPVRS